MEYRKFTFNPFSVNTYVLWDESRECAIIDPGMCDEREARQLFDFVESNELSPKLVLLTHCHLDHILGCEAVYDKWGLHPKFNALDEQSCRRQNQEYLRMFGLRGDAVPPSGGDVRGGTSVAFGQTVLEVFDTPGHSVGSVSFFHRPSKLLISGDVLFYLSIGRTDLEGGDFDTLVRSIREVLFPLGDDVKVLPGHMNETFIGYERRHNPFVKGI
jgi:glyoxylase-like metal-dependent hydrolase (beta-lactamase superfamily II)